MYYLYSILAFVAFLILINGATAADPRIPYNDLYNYKVSRLCLTKSVYEDNTIYEEEPLILKQGYRRYSIDCRCTHGNRSEDFHLTLARHECLLKSVLSYLLRVISSLWDLMHASFKFKDWRYTSNWEFCNRMRFFLFIEPLHILRYNFYQ